MLFRHTATEDIVTVGPTGLGAAADGNIQSVVRAADIIRLFTRGGVSSISVAEASKTLGLQRPTAHRYMTTLVSAQLLRRESETGRFVLGPLAHDLFTAILRERRILAIAPARMQVLADRTSMSTALCVWDGSAALVSHVAYPHPTDMAVRVPVGFRVAPNGAQTLVFLAHMNDPRQLEAALARMPDAEAARARKLVSRARADRFAAVTGDDGVRIIAVPIFDTHGISATVALMSTTRRLPTSPLSAPAQMLHDTAAQLSAELLGESPGECVTPAG
jgi:DNA-binding IclR family transcriptional regulator